MHTKVIRKLQTINLIRDGILFEKTGEVGLYLTYKCLYRHVEENQ